MEKGLSPRVRGNRARLDQQPIQLGPIPASAGEPMCLAQPRSRRRAYPRECGGTRASWRTKSPGVGLSPRVRGNPVMVRAERDEAGPIPASAGEPCSPTMTAGTFRAYPRECGGTRTSRRTRPTATGLSPRVRGNPILRANRPSRRGPIPASAGEPRRAPSWRLSRWAYPRECGGTAARIWHPDQERGLSPRVRGNPGKSRRAVPASGPIPASAGEPPPRR